MNHRVTTYSVLDLCWVPEMLLPSEKVQQGVPSTREALTGVEGPEEGAGVGQEAKAHLAERHSGQHV